MKKMMAMLLVSAFALCVPLTVMASPAVTRIAGAADVAAAVSTLGTQGITINNNPLRPIEDRALEFASPINNVTVLHNIAVRPGETIRIPLTAAMFEVTGNGPVTLAMLNAANVRTTDTLHGGGDMRSRTALGGGGTAYAAVTFIPNIFTDNAVHHNRNFDYTINLTRAGQTAVPLIRIRGRMEGESSEVSDGEEVFIGDGRGVLVNQTVRRVVLDLGNDVTITRDLPRRAAPYFGRAITDPRTRDDNVFERYSGVQRVIRLETAGLRTTGNIVRFDLPDIYYVYNSFGLFIGRSNVALPWWSTYYLSTTRYEHLSGLVN